MASSGRTLATCQLRFELLEKRDLLTQLSPALLQADNVEPASNIGEVSAEAIAVDQATSTEAQPAQTAPAANAFDELAPFTLARNGDGFLLVAGPNSEPWLTRHTEIEVDDQGRLLTANGYQLLGFALDAIGEPAGDELIPLSVAGLEIAARQTAAIELRGVANPDLAEGTTLRSSAVVFGPLGDEINVSITLTRTGGSYAALYDWEVSTPSLGGSSLTIESGTLGFDQRGRATIEHLQLNVPHEDTSFSVLLDFTNLHALGEVNAYGEYVGNLDARQLDGLPMSPLDGLHVGNDSDLNVYYQSGHWERISRVAAAIVANPHGLVEAEAGYYAATPQSGAPKILRENPPYGGSTLQVQPGFKLLPDGRYVSELSDEEPRFDPSFLSTLNIRYPWIVREVEIELDPGERLLVQHANGAVSQSSPQRLRLNAQRELVTPTGLRVLGRLAGDQSALTPITVPLGDTLSEATQNVVLTGQIAPDGQPATTPQTIESVVLYEVDVDAGQANPDAIPDLAALDSRLIDVVIGDSGDYRHLFRPGTLTVGRTAGGIDRYPGAFPIGPETLVADLIEFLDAYLFGDPSSRPQTSGEVSLVEGRIRVVSNLGQANAITFSKSSFTLQSPDASVSYSVPLWFESTAWADGEAFATSFVVYPEEGNYHGVNLYFYLASSDADRLTYRWRAIDWDAPPGSDQTIGFGEVEFVVEGDRVLASPLQLRLPGSDEGRLVALHFDDLVVAEPGDEHYQGRSGLPLESVDGFRPLTLTRYQIASTGEVVGGFSVARTVTLGQVEVVQARPPIEVDGPGSDSPRQGPQQGPQQGPRRPAIQRADSPADLPYKLLVRQHSLQKSRAIRDHDSLWRTGGASRTATDVVGSPPGTSLPDLLASSWRWIADLLYTVAGSLR
ncbi:Flagellar hook protein FlgE [Posidoniimonas polymericola]|uniref:Flagellar hook protein FlgE n=1 Tax=Posidoniimonas polymericola TaxID=2528002 RepID=A0A5C5YT68_9BACT|nr:hypothetical protein [Posidoniimonas polymericola]TWT78155.1 Flagellar hook protein FlgE [Posidoniimonas polymericola]